MNVRTCFCIAIALLLVPAGVAAQDGPLVIPRVDGPIALTGTGDDPAWEAAEPLHLVAHAPTFGGEPSEPTAIRVVHDGQHLYIAARLYDSEPSAMQALSLRRNDNSMSNDWLVIVLDTFNDKETAVSFATTPAGIRTDIEIVNDADVLNFDWDTYWDVEVVQNEQGWFAEFRIPFSSLRFQDRAGQVTMGLSFWRWVARKEELSTYPARPPRWGFISVFMPSQAREIVLEGVESTRPLYVTPYLLGGGGQSFLLNDGATTYQRTDTPVHEVGLDLKYGLTDNLTLDVAVNPDFAQVEADEQETNLTRFSLFFPEKRRFFQERSSAFDFSLGENNRLFHSRRIGLAQGDPVRIHAGARVVGRIGAWDVAALNMQTGASELFAAENFGVARVRRRVLNENSYAGGMLTSRIGSDGERNLAYGLDANLRLFGQDYLTFTWAQTFDDELETTGGIANSYVRGRWERRGTEGFGYALDVSRAGVAFEPSVGFLLRRDYTRLGERLYVGWRPPEGSAIYRHTLSVNGNTYLRNSDGTTETAELRPEWKIETRTGHTLTVGSYSAYEHLLDGFSLAENVDLHAGGYWFHGVSLRYEQPVGAVLQTQANAEIGSFFDGFRTSFSVTPRWRPSRHIELRGTYAFDRVAFGEREQVLNAHVLRGRAEVMFNTTLSAAAFTQYHSAAHAITANIRLRYNPREGRDLYVVYNHGIHTNRHRLEPFLPFTDSRTLLLKYSHTLDWGF